MKFKLSYTLHHKQRDCRITQDSQKVDLTLSAVGPSQSTGLSLRYASAKKFLADKHCDCVEEDSTVKRYIYSTNTQGVWPSWPKQYAVLATISRLDASDVLEM